MKAAELCYKLVDRLAASHNLNVGRPRRAGLLARLLGRRLGTSKYGAYCRGGRIVLWLILSPEGPPEPLEAEAREIIEENFRDLPLPPDYAVWRSRGSVVIEISEDIERYSYAEMMGEDAERLALQATETILAFLMVVEDLLTGKKPLAGMVGVKVA